MKTRMYMSFLTGLIMVSACTKKVDSNDLKEEVPYYQNYEVSYNKDDDKTEASAQFQVRETNGAKIQLTNNNTVTANGTSPSTDILDNTKYTWKFSGQQDVNFTLIKNGNTTIQNNISKTDIGETSFGTDFPLSASKAEGFKFSWTGTSLQSNEVLTVTARKLGTTLVSKEVTGSVIQFTADELKIVPTGTLFVTLKRTKTVELDQKDATASGKMIITTTQSKDMALNE